MLLRIVKRGNNVRQVRRAIRRERLQRQNLRLRRHQMNQSGGHRSMAECDVGAAIEDCDSRLLDPHWSLLLLILIEWSIRQPRYVAPLRGSSLIARKVVTRQQYRD